MVFPIADLLRSPAHHESRPANICDERLIDTDSGLPEVDSVAFLSEDELIVSLYMQREDGMPSAFGSHPERIEIWNLAGNRVVSSARLAELSGPLLPIESDWVLGFHRHPKLIHLPTGTVQQRWPHIETSTRLGSICMNLPPEPIVAMDQAKRRFALSNGQGILVATLQRRAC